MPEQPSQKSGSIETLNPINLLITTTDDIFKSRMMLTEDYHPDKILYRDEEFNKLTFFFKNQQENPITQHLQIMGDPGIGKTLLVKKFIDAMRVIEAQTKIKCIYIKCDDTNTKTKILKEIALKISTNYNIGWGVPDYIQRINEKTKTNNTHLIVVLDEVDKIKDLNSSLYTLTDHPKISLITISNIIGWMHNITDNRVKSRLKRDNLTFGPYNEEQLFQIIKTRAEIGFKPDVCSDEILRMVAKIAANNNGDTRMALNILIGCGDYAKEHKQKKITKEAVWAQEEEQESYHLIDYFEKLPITKKLILLTVHEYSKRNKKNPTIQQITDEYNNKIKKAKTNPQGLKPLSKESMRVYVHTLKDSEILQAVSGGGGKGRGLGKNPLCFEIGLDKLFFEKEIYQRYESPSLIWSNNMSAI